MPPIRTPYLQVTMEGQEITPWVTSVSCTEDDRQADSCTVIIPDPRLLYADAIIEGSEVEIDLGYAEPNQHALLLRAVIVKVEASYAESGTPQLTLKGNDRSILMGLRERKRVWRQRTVGDVVRAIGGEHGYVGDRINVALSPDPDISSRFAHQDGKTDLAFLQELARRYFAKCFVELNERGQEVLYFIPERRVVTLNRPDQLVLRYRQGPTSNLTSFTPSFDSTLVDRLKAVDDVDQRGNRIQTQDKPRPPDDEVWSLDDRILAQASEGDRRIIQALYERGRGRKKELQQQLTEKRPVVGEVAPDQASLDADNDFLESNRLGMTASGSTFGNIWLRAKSKVTVAGVNARFRGDWYVNQVTHKLDAGGFKTDFRCVR